MKGFMCAAGAGVLWGILPVYWKMLSPIQPIHVLAARIIFSFIFVAIILLAQKNMDTVRLVRQKPLPLFLSGVVVCANWGIYIFAVQRGQTVQASLGYYMNPLVSIVFGLIVLKEKLLPLQWASVIVAAVGVGILTAFAGVFPWISFSLAFTFGVYGLLKKTIIAGALEGLGAETFFSLPIAAILILLPMGTGASYVFNEPLPIIVGILLAGPITAAPLFLFAKGTKALRLSTLGFIQFICPTLQFLSGVFVLGEPFPVRNLIPFSIVWIASFLYILSFAKRPVVRK